MRKASTTMIGLIFFLLGAGARAGTAAVAAPPVAPVSADAVPAGAVERPAPVAVARARRWEAGLSVLAMGPGTVTSFDGTMTQSGEATFAYGGSLWASYRVIAGLTVGLAPQVLIDVAAKGDEGLKEYNLLARIGYEMPILEGMDLYVAALPGYSLKPGGAKVIRGPVVVFEAGMLMDLSDRTFANLGVGYQLGYQDIIFGPGAQYPDRENYLRIEIGGGLRF